MDCRENIDKGCHEQCHECEKYLQVLREKGAIVAQLAEQSLKEKWYDGSKVLAGKLCPFCYSLPHHNETFATTFRNLLLSRHCRIDVCAFCICPPVICSKAAGIIKGAIMEGCVVADLPELADIIKLFHRYMKLGRELQEAKQE